MRPGALGLGAALAAALATTQLVLGSIACSTEEPPSPNRAHSAPPPAAPVLPRAPAAPERLDLVQALPLCEIDHQGRLFDFGVSQLPLRAFAPPRAEPPAMLDRGGDSFERIFTREVLLDFWLDEPTAELSVSVRLHAVTAKWLYVSLDDKRLGAQKLTLGETRSLALPSVAAPLAKGRHRLALRLAGAPRGSKEPQIDLDWVRIGPRLENAASYAAPTLRDVVSDVVLDGVPKRSIVLRAPSVVRCYLRPARDATLRAGLGFWGNGRGTAEIALLSDEKPPRVLSSRKLSGGDGGSFTSVALDLGAAAGEVVALELRAPEGSRGGRVVFGDPFITRASAELPRSPGAQTVVIVVLASVDRARLPPWGRTGGMSTLADLAKHAAAFSAHRAPSTIAAASLASLLSGASPAVHGIQAPGDKLRDKLVTLAETVKEAGGRTAFFTGVPTSFAPFGFRAGFDAYETFSPVSDVPAIEPLSRAVSFLEHELGAGGPAQRLVVVELRGGHPPWDLTREETLALKPQEYSGILDPRRAGIVLGALREKQRKSSRKIGDDDWIRLRTLHDAALVKQDAALGKLVTLLKQKGAWDDTLLIVTSDVGLGAGPDIPFDPAGPLGEDRLTLPLLVKFPGSALGGQEITQPTKAEDVAFTVAAALGLDLPRGAGADLFARASGVAPLTGAVDVAAAGGNYAVRLGSWLLRGSTGKVPRLCISDIDPSCTSDALDQKPIASRALWLGAFADAAAAERLAAATGPSVRAELDPETLAALTVWGDLR